MDIPQDIIDTIIGKLRNDRTALQQCALVSHSFLVPSRKYLFAVIEIRSFLSSAQQLSEVLACNPSIICYIRELRLYTVYDIQGLLQILNTGSLQSFTYEPFDDHKLSDETRNSIIELLKSPSIHTIKFRCSCWCECNVLIESLAYPTGLKHLSLWITDTCTNESGHKLVDPGLLVRPQQARYLESLEIDCTRSTGFTNHLLRPDFPINILRLRELIIWSPESKAGLEVLQAVSGTIESLIWTESLSPGRLNQFFPTISTLSHLRSLVFVIHPFDIYIYSSKRILASSIMPTSLEQFVIVVHYSFSTLCAPNHHMALYDMVSPMVSQSTHHRVPQVHLWLVVDLYNPHFKEVHADLVNRFQSLSSTGHFLLGFGNIVDSNRIISSYRIT